jgi:glycosyltransferase involved in cell wall biosynthesis
MTVATSEALTAPLYTVFTPAYNRAHTLHRVYESLQAQTFRNFEWIIVDDGSADGTDELVAGWAKVASFPIKYLYQTNSGKHIAINRGVAAARGELFLIIDSDDGFLPQSLQIMLDAWLSIPEVQRRQFTGVVTRCQTESGQPYSPPFKSNPLDTTALDVRFRDRINGELWGFHRTQVMREFPFPEDTSVKMIPENIVWDAIARRYKIRCINDMLRIFFQDSGNQLTKGDPRRKASHRHYFLKFVNRDCDYFWFNPAEFFRWAALYGRYSLHAGDVKWLSPARFDGAGPFLLAVFAAPVAVAAFLIDCLRSRRG